MCTGLLVVFAHLGSVGDRHEFADWDMGHVRSRGQNGRVQPAVDLPVGPPPHGIDNASPMSSDQPPTTSTMQPNRRPVRLPGLDGLRAVAVIAVLFYHGGFGWAKGGYLGVDLFFVLSGFLISGLLIGEVQRSGTVSLRDFWIRRARRL